MEESVTSISLQRWHQGDSNALNVLIENNLSWIRGNVQKRIGAMLQAKGDASDYVQDAVVQFLQYGPRFTISSDGRFRGLLLKIVENMLCNKYHWFTARRRDMARERPLPSDTVLNLDPPKHVIDSPSQSAMKHEEEAWVRLGIELVDPEDREILILRQWDGLSLDKIARQLGISLSAAQSRHFRAVKRLAAKISTLRRGDLDGL